METLEIELSYLPQLLDDEVARILYQQCTWGMLADCAQLFDLDASNIKRPLDVLPVLIVRKADERLSKEKAKRFKAAWQQLTPMQQVHIAMAAWQRL